MTETDIVETSEERTRVGFPEAPEKKRGFNFRTFIVFLLLLLLIGAGAWFLFGRTPGEEEVDDVTPTVSEEVIEETPTPSPEVTVDKETLKVRILNGSGVSGAAGRLQDILEKLGYTQFELGNASNYSYKATEISFSSTIPESLKEEIIEELEKSYTDVRETGSASGEFDISIIIGTTKGSTPVPTSRTGASPTLRLSPTPTGSGGTNTITPTKTPTPSVTP